MGVELVPQPSPENLHNFSLPSGLSHWVCVAFTGHAMSFETCLPKHPAILLFTCGSMKCHLTAKGPEPRRAVLEAWKMSRHPADGQITYMHTCTIARLPVSTSARTVCLLTPRPSCCAESCAVWSPPYPQCPQHCRCVGAHSSRVQRHTRHHVSVSPALASRCMA